MPEHSPSELLFDIQDQQWPIVFHIKYDISFWGVEKIHSFDAKKWGKVINFLIDSEMIGCDSIVSPREAKTADLLLVHTRRYLNSLKWSCNIAKITEVPIVAVCPNFCVQRHFLKPMRLQTGGSILAGKLALDRGWSINVGGGFHHCSSDKGMGFCPYADITLLIRNLMIRKLVKTAMIVDLDAHQGNGHERDFLNDDAVYIMDMYNCRQFPKDEVAKRAIRRRIELKPKCEDLEYMAKLRTNFKEALNEFTPDIVVYNAGTDILCDDPLGGLRITGYCVIKRDEFIFSTCRGRKIPIVMLTSGGYQRSGARLIADSILNLYQQGLIENPHQPAKKLKKVKAPAPGSLPEGDF